MKAAQCGQVIDAYSMTVTDAFAGPSAISPNGLGVASAAAMADCAEASVISGHFNAPKSAASPVADSAAVKARRVMDREADEGRVNGVLLKSG